MAKDGTNRGRPVKWTTPPLVCQECGQSFTAQDMARKYLRKVGYKCGCCINAENLARSEQKKGPNLLTCAICGGSVPRRGISTCGSVPCLSEWDRRQEWIKLGRSGLPPPLVVGDRVCPGCHTLFMPSSNRTTRRVYCSPRCQARSADRSPARLSQKRDRQHWRRASRLTAERLDWRDIAERDGWRCRLCGKRINRRLVFPHVGSPSIDHVVPLSLGGPHTRANVQLAHLGCNAKKNNGFIDRGEQLRLIG